jgi:hypothetical protein
MSSADAARGAPLRSALTTAAGHEAGRRYAESVGGLVASGALLGVGFAAQGEDMTWSHSLWVASGIVGVGSLVQLFVPSRLERLAMESETSSDAKLRADWQKIVDDRKAERRFGAVVGSLVGVAGIVVGTVVLNGEGGDLSSDSRKILGTTLVVGGGASVVDGVVNWFLPTALERDFAMLKESKALSFSAAPTLGGATASVTGAF